MKKIISACIDQVIQFDSEQEVNDFLEHLKSRKQRFTVVWDNTLNSGKVQIRIRRQYNNHFMESKRISEMYDKIPIEEREAIFFGKDGDE